MSQNNSLLWLVVSMGGWANVRAWWRVGQTERLGLGLQWEGEGTLLIPEEPGRVNGGKRDLGLLFPVDVFQGLNLFKQIKPALVLAQNLLGIENTQASVVG